MAQNLNFNLSVDTNSAVASINQFFSAFDAGSAKAKGELNKAFGQTLQTNVEINLKNGELVAKKIQNINQESKRLETAVKAINGQWGKTPNELKRQISTLKTLQGNTQKYSDSTKKVSADWKKVTDRIRQAEKALKEMTVGGSFDQMKAGLSGIIGKFALVQTLANAATGVLMGAGRALMDFADMAGRMETLSLQMEAFTGSTEAADAAFNQFIEIAAKTPFNLEQVAGAGKIMMAFGVDTETAVKATEQLGIVSAATGGDISLLARNLGQIAAQGQAYTRDLTQFAIQGIPIWEQMSLVTGQSVAALKDMASNGEISFAIVSEALNNLTQEGSAFAEIAERMQETFQGRMARIEASLNKLSQEFIKTFNSMDKALGGIISGSMKAFADGIMAVANNMDTVAKVLVSLTAATIAYFALSNWYVIANGVGAVIGFVSKLLTTQMALNAAQAFFTAMTPGGLLKVAAAAGVAAIAYKAVGDAIDNNTGKTDEMTDSIEGSITATKELTERQKQLAAQAGLKEMIADHEEARKKLEEKNEELKEEKKNLEDMIGVVKENAQEQINGIRDSISAQKELRSELKESHAEQLSDIRKIYDAKLDSLDVELGKLREKTKSEKALYDLEKKELQEKIKSGKLDKEDLLRAQARLERMEAQEKIAELLKKKAEVQADKESDIADAKERQTNELKAMDESIKSQELNVKALERARDAEIKKIKEALKEAEAITSEIGETNYSVAEQIGLVSNLATQYNTAKQEAEGMAVALNRAVQQQRLLNSAKKLPSGGASSMMSSTGRGTPTTSNFAGGPIAAGTTSWVNELGKEAFLSASGRLSMINDNHGKWTAPSDGTIIPAHLTKQLSVPTGGINLSRAATSNASRAGSNGMGGVISAIRGAMRSGDTFNQSVTVQSSNPTQTANNMMVEMTRLRRRRMG